MPMIPFIGVRISWLMVARKSLLAWLAASARVFSSLKVSTRASCSKIKRHNRSRSAEGSLAALSKNKVEVPSSSRSRINF